MGTDSAEILPRFQAGFRAGIYADVAREVIRSSMTETRANRRAAAAKLRWAVRTPGRS